MKNTLKNRIVSAVIAGCLVMTTLMSPVTAFSEENTEIAAPFGVATVGDAERTVYALMPEDEETNVSVYSSEEESVIEVNPVEVNPAEEGLEVLESYVFTDKTSDPSWREIAEADTTEIVNEKYVTNAEASGESLWVAAEPAEDISLNNGETVSLYNVVDNEITDVIVEDITTLEEPVEVDDEANGIALVKDTGYRHLNLVLYPENSSNSAGENSVILDGMMPTNALAQAVDVTTEFALKRAGNNEVAGLPYSSNGIASFTDAMEATDTDAIDKTDTDSIDTADTDKYTSGKTIAAYDITIKDGRAEYQPDEERPICVEIKDERITAEDEIQLWHIKDDGTREQVTDFTLEEGKVSFSATGFSVYEIAAEPAEFNPGSIDLAKKISDLVSERAEDGFFIGYGNKYAKSSLNNNNCLVETESLSEAAIWYFDIISSDEDVVKVNIYTYVDGIAKYIFCPNNSNNVQLSSENNKRTLFKITETDITKFTNFPDTFSVKKDSEERWLQHSNGGGGIRLYTSQGDNNNINDKIKFSFVDTYLVPDDYYELDGKTYGIMHYTGGSVGNALMADVNKNSLSMLAVSIRSNSGKNTIFTADDKDISMWTFTNKKSDKYVISTSNSAGTKYIKISSTGISLVASESEASVVKVTADSKGRIRISTNDGSISYDSTAGFGIGNDDENIWLNLVDVSDIDEAEITYSAEKVGVSEVKTGESVIVYTRIWDNTNKKYAFYAIDHDGKLYPCYERGDNIMWVGDKINTLLWDFTEYRDDDGKVNYFYELYNPYSDKYLAPLINGGQVLSDKTIGINMPGRRDGEYYSTILAWDNDYYSYAGLVADNSDFKVTSGPKSDADTFYFARPTAMTPTLTKVETINNSDYGITMKMINFEKRSDQSSFLGDNTGTTGSPPKQGLLSTDLGADGYPTTALEKASTQKVGSDYDPTKYVSGRSLGDLFTGATTVNHLFIESTYSASGYFEFDSCQNFATLVQEDGSLGTDFIVYKDLGTMDVGDPRPSLKHGQFMPYNTITPGVYSQKNPENIYDALTDELSKNDPRKYEKLHLVNGTPDYHNGMEIGASFVQTPNGKDAWGHDIIFEFTGDDDFWFYIDGELLIDLGGIHSALSGKVNFCTGDVEVYGKKTNLRQVFKENYLSRNKNAGEDEVNTYLDQFFEEGENIFKDYSEHSLKIFYMERGAGASNLHMRFNLSYVTPGSVMLSKNITGTDALGDDIDFSLVEFPYQIWYKLDAETTDEEAQLLTNETDHLSVTYQNSTQKVDFRSSYTPPKATKSYENVYFLSPGKVAEIHFPENTYAYKIVECGVNSEVYDSVTVPGVDPNYIESHKVQTPGNSSRFSYETPWSVVEDRKTVEFDNHVDEAGLRTLTIDKELWDESGNKLLRSEDPTTFSFRLYLTNGADDILELANMRKYHVRDELDNLCKWDYGSHGFVSTGESDYSNLSEREKNAVTFETSMNGAISQIPAGYSVEVTGLPVGTLFKVEERDYEIPLGYKWVKYSRTGDTFYTADAIEDGDTLNSGRVRAGESPMMTVVNQRGWEIELNKIWTDKKYMQSHDPIYTAVYVEGDNEDELVLVPDTVKKIVHPNTSLRYFFNPLQSGKTFDQYHVYEVVLTNPVVNTSGEIESYDSITPLQDGDFISINALAKKSSAPALYSYAASYEQGTATQTATGADENGNIRTDTITNTRTGGVVVTLFDMKTKEVLPGGEFLLQEYDPVSKKYVDIDTYTADNHGRITILYDFKRDTDEVDYKIIENESPHGYIGLPNPVTFQIQDDNEVIVNGNGNEARWQNGRKSDVLTDELVAYINVYNKPYTLEVYKYDGDSNGEDGLSSAAFELYRGVKGGLGGIVKDRTPMAGYENLVTDANGLIPSVDNNLATGRYYLTEKTPPPGYKAPSGDIVFDISANGGLELISSPKDAEAQLILDNETDEDAYIYHLRIPNSKDALELTVTKTVDGAFGNKAKDFTFTFSIEGDDGTGTTTYAWKKNGEDQTTPLKSNGTFTLGHQDSVAITVPAGKKITISEDNGDYTTTFKLDDEVAVKRSSYEFELNNNKTLSVTNTKDGVIPTGVESNISMLITLFGVFLSLVIIFMWRLNCRRKRRLRDE